MAETKFWNLGPKGTPFWIFSEIFLSVFRHENTIFGVSGAVEFDSNGFFGGLKLFFSEKRRNFEVMENFRVRLSNPEPEPNPGMLYTNRFLSSGATTFQAGARRNSPKNLRYGAGT